MATSAKPNPRVVPIDDGAAAASSAAPKKKSKKLLYLAFFSFLLLIAGVGTALYLTNSSAADAGVAEEKTAEPPVFIAMEPFTVNLQEEFGEQYLQVVFTLQVADQEQVDQIKLYMPLVRSRILMLLASKKPSELKSEAGKIKLQDEIAAQVTLPFTPNGPPQKVTGVFFTSFVIQ